MTDSNVIPLVPVVDEAAVAAEVKAAFEQTVNSIADQLSEGPMPLVFLSLIKADTGAGMPGINTLAFARDEEMFAMTLALISLLGRSRLGALVDQLPENVGQIACQVEGMKMVNKYLTDAVRDSKRTPAGDAAGLPPQ